ncbi:MAG TPA: S1 RNA-binding domain-containing protein [Chloroflexota bacterium]|nr:S1 RNA-binding domain-containing protein [Chloroflexota bacterium]
MDEEQRTGDPEASQPGAREARDTGQAAGPEEQLSMQQLLEAEEASVREVRRGQVVDGTVVRIDPDEVLVDIGLKSEGLIPGRELSSIEEELDHPLRVGDTILVYVVTTETPEGHALLSFRRAGTERFWRRAQQQVETGEVVEARVVEYNKGGLVVLYGTRAFVPISQLANVQRAGDTEEEQEQVAEQLRGLVGQTLKLKVIEADRKRNRLILSERQASRELRSQRRDQLLLELEPGQVRQGRVSNVASFGAFVDLGGADGLVHISELSWSRVKHPSEVVKPGQEVDVYVISVDRDTKKIALSLRRAQEDPWLTIEDRYPLGSIVFGQVIKQAQFGVFVRLDDGIEGLVHNSEIAPTDRRLLQEGSRLTFRVISIDLDRRRLRLSPAPEAMPEEDDFETPEEAQASASAPDEAPAAEPQPEPEAEPPAPPQPGPGAEPQAAAQVPDATPAEGDAPPQEGPAPEPAPEAEPDADGATGATGQAGQAGQALQSTAGSPAGAAPAPGRRSDDAA